MERERVAEVYQRFAELEARGISETYAAWADSIARDADILDRIATLPGMKKQPNLVFAAARFAGAPVGPYAPMRDWLVEHWDAVVPVVMSRSTQTNEAGRCAVLLPVLSRLDGPLSLIEAGASAGLVLYPDRYGYDYDTGGEIFPLDPIHGPSPVRLACRIDRRDLPNRLPEVAWRAGVDLNPIDVRDGDQLAWLEALVWPEHEARRVRLHAAAAVAAADPPTLVRGDILDAIPGLVERAPPGSRVVVFHSAVLVYLAPERRDAFVDMVSSLPDVTWISNEGEGVLPSIAQQVREPIHGRTIVAVDGQAVALVGPHGQSYQALRTAPG